MRTRSIRAIAPLARLAALNSVLMLAGCQGTIEDGGPAGDNPGASGSGAKAGSSQGTTGGAPGTGSTSGVGASSAAGTATTPSSGGAAVGGTSSTGSTGGAGSANGGTAGTGQVTDPTAVPGELSAPYTRLTRAEYQATIKAAFNLVDVPVSGIPDDNRIGPFTSNALSPDPVQEFLLASEELAALIVPGKLPACASASASTCVTTSYQAPFERLYRRPLTPAELTALSTLLSSLQSQGITAEASTRAMVTSALISGDFLFRATPLSGDANRGRRLAEHLSYALVDAPPDADLVNAGKASPAQLGARLKEQAARLGSDARAVPVMARFLAQWLHVDVDNRLADNSASFASSPVYAELLAFAKNALTTNVTVRSFVNGTQGFIHKNNFGAYAMSPVTGTADVIPVSWSGTSVRRGLLGEELFLDTTRHPDPSRRPIFRGHLVRSAFLCQEVAAPPPDAVDLNAEIADRTVDTRCAGCHRMMDPIGKAFAPMDLDNTMGAPAPEVIAAGELTGVYDSLPQFLDAIAGSQTYADCFSRHLLGFFLEQEPALVDAAAVGDVSAVVKSGGGFADAVGQAVASLDKRSSTAVPWCSGQ